MYNETAVLSIFLDEDVIPAPHPLCGAYRPWIPVFLRFRSGQVTGMTDLGGFVSAQKHKRSDENQSVEISETHQEARRSNMGVRRKEERPVTSSCSR